MNSSKVNWGKLLPVFLSYVVMGFVDIIGVATGYIKQDFKLSDFIVQFLPMMVLLWFFVLSVPAGILQDRYGKRNMLNLGMVIQAAGLGLPFVHYSFGMMFASFILLGIGNTVIQVSANPLLQDVSSSEKLPSYLSTSQFIKAVISFSGPLIATFFAVSFGEWRLVFAVYGITSIAAAVWLSATQITESKPDRKPASFSSCFGLLGNRFITLMALSIFLIVGAEVAVNTNIANVLVARYSITFERAALGISIFFAGETIARFLGAVVLNFIRPGLFLLIIALLALAGVAGVIMAPYVNLAFVSIFILGLGAGSMFPVIFSIALKKKPDRANEISGLLIMAVSGGAVIPLVMGLVSTLLGPVVSLSIIAACMLYILWVSWYVRNMSDQ
ncbi:MAG: sugar MFS transporter [Bacteroidales bacterium]|jgi:fucose permease|nr:sugar MFS transporter [Bacteroidales bacterium]